MADKLFKLEIISPDKIFYNNDVEMVEYNTVEGEVGVYASHIPMTQILAPGELIITESAESKKNAALHTGFVEITGDKVTILTESVEWPEDIDLKRAEEAKIRAERRLSSESGEYDIMRAELALKKALLRIDMAAK
ncbi:MAG: ATP synthase F1 subunit epsilon [Eubacteriales bacterium]|nr:ATP synthase F1 subunit epsilon [Eubacteriales bacterium]